MKKLLALITISLLFIFVACTSGEGEGEGQVTVVTVHPSAEPLLITMTHLAKTVEALETTATVYGYTATPTFTPTKPPDPNIIKSILVEAIQKKLVGEVGLQISEINVVFGPLETLEYTFIYIEMKREGGMNYGCPASHETAVVIDAFKDNKKKIKENVPETIQKLMVTITNPEYPAQVVEIDWSDVIAYIDGDIPMEVFAKLISCVQY